MRIIQSKTLPENWIELIERFDIAKSNLSTNNQIIATKLMPIILKQKEEILADLLCRSLVEYIIFKDNFLSSYDNLPQSLIKNGLNEINSERGIHLMKKLHSLFIEFLTYQDLCKKGYKIDNFTKENGSCDLVVCKDNKIYNIEVKFKESPDVIKSRLLHYIDGYSLLKENEFLRNKSFDIRILKALNDKNVKHIIEEIYTFIKGKEHIYEGDYIKIFGIKKSDMKGNSILIETIDDVDTYVEDLFIGKDKPLTKLINKSKKYNKEENFIGCLVWSIPFCINMDNEKIKCAFQKFNLKFDLLVYVSGIGTEGYNFYLKSNR